MIYAQISNNTIVNTIELNDESLLPLFQIDQNGNSYDSVIEIESIIPQPGIGWTFDNVNWNSPPAPPAVLDSIDTYMTIVQAAMTFGQSLMVQFSAQNIISGITQAGQTGAVMSYTANLIPCLTTGSLYEAITVINGMIADTSTTKTALAPFVTNDLLYSYMNQIQGYLGIPLTTNPGP